MSLQHSLLHLAQLHADNQLRLGRHVLEHVGLEPPKHVWPQQVMQLLDLIFLGNVGKLLQEAFQIAATKNQGISATARVDHTPPQGKPTRPRVDESGRKAMVSTGQWLVPSDHSGSIHASLPPVAAVLKFSEPTQTKKKKKKED